jgi:NAD+ kinase
MRIKIRLGFKAEPSLYDNFEIIRMPKQKGMTIAVFAKHGSSYKQDQWRSVADLLLAHQFKVLVCDSVLNGHAGTPPLREAELFADIETIRQRADAAVIIGGDGTFLSIARTLANYDIPLVGINQGRLGFLTDIRLDDMEPNLIETLRGNNSREARYFLEGQLLRNGEVLANHIALNDIVISRGTVGGMVELGVEVDGHFMYDLRADGLIVSTPTGSTAYALSAHGPILHPSLEGIVMVPVAPHALTNRPIALPKSCVIDITIIGGKQTGMHFDMQINARVKLGDVIRIQVAPKPIHLLHPKRYDYFAMLRQKLHWSATPTDLAPQTRGLRESSHAK